MAGVLVYTHISVKDACSRAKTETIVATNTTFEVEDNVGASKDREISPTQDVETSVAEVEVRSNAALDLLDHSLADNPLEGRVDEL